VPIKEEHIGRPLLKLFDYLRVHAAAKECGSSADSEGMAGDVRKTFL
jgi:hypothetical protein